MQGQILKFCLIPLLVVDWSCKGGYLGGIRTFDIKF